MDVCYNKNWLNVINIMASKFKRLKFDDVMNHAATPAQLDEFLNQYIGVAQDALLLALYEFKKREAPKDAEKVSVVLHHWNKNACQADLGFVFELCALNNWVAQADELLNICTISDDKILRGMEYACHKAHTDFLLYMIEKSDALNQKVNVPVLLKHMMEHNSNKNGHQALKTMLNSMTIEVHLNEVILQTLAYSNFRSSKMLFPYIDAPTVWSEYKKKWYATTDVEQWFENAYAGYQKSVLNKSLPKSKPLQSKRKM